MHRFELSSDLTGSCKFTLQHNMECKCKVTISVKCFKIF